MLAIGELQDGTARAFNWADLSLWPTFVIRPVAIIFAMFVALQFGFAATAVTAMGASIVATWATTLGQLFFLRHRVRKTVPAGPRVYTPRAWLAVALPILLVEGFFNLLTNVDILMVGHLMDPDSVAIYFAAAKTLAVVHFVYFSVRAGSAQRFSQYSAAGDRVSLEAFVRDTLHWTFWPSLAIVLMLVVVGEPLLALFGSGFTAGYPLLFILSAGLLVRAAIGPAGTLLTMSGQQGISAIIYVFTFALNIVLTLLLIPRFGLSGAATATALSLVAESVALYVVVLSRLGIHCSILSVVGPWRTLKAS
jgi:O-antigen/teichoic acid export membrane protein